MVETAKKSMCLNMAKTAKRDHKLFYPLVNVISTTTPRRAVIFFFKMLEILCFPAVYSLMGLRLVPVREKCVYMPLFTPKRFHALQISKIALAQVFMV